MVSAASMAYVCSQRSTCSRVCTGHAVLMSGGGAPGPALPVGVVEGTGRGSLVADGLLAHAPSSSAVTHATTRTFNPRLSIGLPYVTPRPHVTQYFHPRSSSL